MQIQNKFYLLTKTNSSSITAANLTLFTQNAEDRVNQLLLRADQRWSFDDSNYSDLPIATTGLVSGQQDYSLATTHFTIDRVEVQDTAGNWTVLRPISNQEIQFESLESHLKTNGLPIEYRKVGNSIFLYPIPNYTQAASLKVYFTRGVLKFDYSLGTFTDGTGSTASSPGFNAMFHDLIALWASYDFAVANALGNAQGVMAAIQQKEQELNDFYGLRRKDERHGMGVSTYQTYGTQSGRIGNSFSDSTR